MINRIENVIVNPKLNLDSYGGGFTARALTFLMFWLISA
jgi:hypothetical protein